MDEARKASHIKYNKSAKGLARRDRYNHGPRQQAARQRYGSKPEVKEQHKWLNRGYRLRRRLRETTL